MAGINKESQEISKEMWVISWLEVVSKDQCFLSKQRSEWQKAIEISGKRTYLKIEKITHIENNGFGIRNMTFKPNSAIYISYTTLDKSINLPEFQNPNL